VLDWEEGAFKGGKALFDALWVRRRRKPYQAAEVTLASMRMELFYLAHLVAGCKIALFESDDPLLRIGHRICLPRSFSGHVDPERNREFYRVKCGLAALSLCGQDFRERMHVELPGLYAMMETQVETLPPGFPWGGHFGAIGQESETSTAPVAFDADEDADAETNDNGIEKDATEIEGAGRTQVEVLLGEDLKAPDVPQHTFEQVETLEEFDGIDRQVDGVDDIEDHQEALKELEMRHVMRSKDRAASIYKADILMSPFELESRGNPRVKGIPYPEWDFRKKAYKPDWCRVQVRELEGFDTAWSVAATSKHESRIRELKRRLAAFSVDTLRMRAQPLGDEFDLQAVLEACIRMRAGGHPSENIYMHRRRDLADVATLILVDLSDSTDAWVQGEHVLDTMRGTLYCLGEILQEFTAAFGMAGFASKTRHECRYVRIKDLDAPWTPVIPKLGALQAQGYTRMGPILRHAIHELEKRPERRKAILLVTDGRPCDYDTYEGRYGIQDVKKAFGEARDKGMVTHAFAVDRRAREYFPTMFAPRQFSVIGRPHDLPEAIVRFFMTLKV
jgi:nitric oxide reductase NorD protein